MKQLFLYLSFLLLCLQNVRADWSPEIVLYRNPASVVGESNCANIVVDSTENAHILYEYRLPTMPEHLTEIFKALVYMKFDDHGNVLVQPISLHDSLDVGAADPRIRLFGMDSLWISWIRFPMLSDSITHDPACQAQRTMDLNGNFLGALRIWPETPYGNVMSAPIAILPDRSIAYAYTCRNHRTIRCVVQNPDGARPLNHDLIWFGSNSAYVEDVLPIGTDSLQIAWTQWWGGQSSTCTKRICVTHSFDSQLVGDSSLLSPANPGEQWDACEFIRHDDDSLLTYRICGPGDSQYWARSYLNTVRRSDYSLVAQSFVGGCDYGQYTAFEPGGTISAWSSLANEQLIRIRRFSWPELAIVQDSVFGPWGPNILSYVISPAGTRHVIYRVDIGSRDIRVVYRYWRADLPVDNPSPAIPSSDFMLYPTPTNGGLFVQGPIESVKALSVFNVLGQQVMSLPIPSGSNGMFSLPQIDALSTGAYYLKLQTRNGETVRKFVVAR
jgi:hypothetical protein